MTVHTTNASRVVAVVAATGLVIASAGFGAVYAYSVGIQHGIALAGLTILFAVALELVKPLAIHGALQSLSSWRTWPRAVCLGILGACAVAYSLTAEISLTASSKADLSASRKQQGETADSGKVKYDQALDELKLIHPSRTVPEVEADIVRTTDLKRIAKLKGEKARTERREKLQAIVNTYKPGMQREADPGSASIQTYLASVGLSIKLDDLGRWLTLVPVLALEIGSALAMVLVASMRGPGGEPQLSGNEASPTATVLDPVETRPERLLPNHSAHREAVAKLILSHLENHGGTIRGNERQIARDLGTTKPTLRRTLQSLAGAGRVVASATKKGTVLQLL